MKIIKEGLLPGEKLVSGTCSKCGAVIECKDLECVEIKREFNSNRMWEHPCPTRLCDKNIKLFEVIN